MPSKAIKLGVSVLATASAALMIAGAYSLWTGGSLVRRVSSSGSAVFAHYDRERMIAAASNPGHARVHPDPRIGYVFKAEAEFELAGATARTDSHGLRVRVGPPPTEDALRIAVLGDSVAFGHGLRDDECLAHQLEVVLTEARGPGARPVVCNTVAVSGWNYVSSTRYLMAHYDRFRPDIVLFLPIKNDLSDNDVVLETGHRAVGPNVGAVDPWLYVNFNRSRQLLRAFEAQAAAGLGSFAPGDIGPLITNADLGGESSRRYDDMAAAIGELDAFLDSNGGRLALAQYRPNSFSHHLLRRLWSELPDLPVFFLLKTIEARDTLGHDPHPNANTVRTLAIWIARELLERGWVEPGEDLGLPAADPAHEARRATTWSPADIQRFAEEARGKDYARLRPEIDFDQALGIRQVYGGLSLRGTVGARLLAALEHAGDVLRIELEPLPGRDDFYPVSLDVEVNGRSVGQITVGGPGAPGVTTAEFSLPSPPAPGAGAVPVPPLEVKLIAPRWMTIPEDGGQELASCRFRRMTCSEE